MELAGKSVVVLGAGRSGRAAAELALSKGANVRVYDANPAAHFEAWKPEIVGYSGASEELGATVASDVLVLSPGIDTYGSFVAAFSRLAGEVLGEIELASRYYQGKVIGITGTNGKTTTTALIEHLIQAAGFTCVACGNYGKPLAEVVLEGNDPDFVSLELSSFQLETVKEFHADVAIWLNFSADHMDRYTSLQTYFDAKRQIFKNQTSRDTAVYRQGEDLGELVAQGVTFSSVSEDADYTLDGHQLLQHGKPILDMRDSALRGSHNAENVMAAIAALEALAISVAEVLPSLANFSPPEHRCEFVASVKGVDYINDSKATNIHALQSALNALPGPIVLIAGGKEKGLEYEELLPTLSKTVKHSVVFGEIARKLEARFSLSVPVTAVETLDEAILVAHDVSAAGDTVLLSPGTSSFDQFPSYEARGKHFKKLVESLPL
ncbi:UDP-N-acetylmuramoyl-L-alanine--D-glutamate ligase [Rubritalea marina]|uniref:UDP-N-acetylmuramoyl-L-alanine--D-glutamate ligase n=1 Tax=Rubritalea marina TaxID=361055 RepID=UPI00037CF02A|nr:UDP-N-acetylmuramoyl-L-alanine--D-glutamate ligase [Rubritalea marina]